MSYGAAKARHRATAGVARPVRASRAHWVKLIGDARALALLAQSAGGEAPEPRGGGGSDGEAVATFRRELRGVDGRSFPDGERIASTGLVAAAFVNCGDAFAVASPERRSAIAPTLGALAGLLDDFLTELRTAEARSHHWMERD